MDSREEPFVAPATGLPIKVKSLALPSKRPVWSKLCPRFSYHPAHPITLFSTHSGTLVEGKKDTIKKEDPSSNSRGLVS